jgi:hypothetical protein
MDQTKRRIDEAILLHQQGMRQDGLRVPRPKFLAELRRKRLLWDSFFRQISLPHFGSAAGSD